MRKKRTTIIFGFSARRASLSATSSTRRKKKNPTSGSRLRHQSQSEPRDLLLDSDAFRFRHEIELTPFASSSANDDRRSNAPSRSPRSGSKPSGPSSQIRTISASDFKAEASSRSAQDESTFPCSSSSPARSPTLRVPMISTSPINNLQIYSTTTTSES